MMTEETLVETPPSTEDLKISLNVKFLYPGVILKGDVYSQTGEKVLEGGKPVTDEFLHELNVKNVTHVYYYRNALGAKTRGDKKIVDPSLIEKTMSIVQEMEHSVKMKALLPVQDIDSTVTELVANIAGEEDAVLNLVDLKEYDDYTYTHSINVCILSILLSKKMKMGDEFAKFAGMAALLHDQGKIMIPKEILNKPDVLTKEEFEIMKRHPIFSYEIINSTGAFNLLTKKGVLYHHEKYNGKGYPACLFGDVMGDMAQIISVSDVYDAITTNRPYRKAKPGWYALVHIHEQISESFTPKIAGNFIQHMPEHLVTDGLFGEGAVVRLNTGEVAEVVRTNRKKMFYPLIRIYFDMNREPLKFPVEVSLESDHTRHISEILEEPLQVDEITLLKDRFLRR